MSIPDLNLLIALDAVLSEASVARAARRLRLSPSAMSRALARLRETTGDPLLVRAGRGLVPTPRALELRAPVARLLEEALAALRPPPPLEIAQLRRSFTLRTREGFLENVGATLVARVQEQAPHVRLLFVEKTDKESTALREGTVDLDIGVVGKAAGPEVRTRALFGDRFVGVVRAGHRLTRERMTAARFASAQHISVSRQRQWKDTIDDGLLALGLERQVVTVVGSFAAALALARGSELLACVPERQTAALRLGMHTFALPLPAPAVTVAMLWHPRFDADAGHRWLRGLVLDLFAPVAGAAMKNDP